MVWIVPSRYCDVTQIQFRVTEECCGLNRSLVQRCITLLGFFSYNYGINALKNCLSFCENWTTVSMKIYSPVHQQPLRQLDSDTLARPTLLFLLPPLPVEPLSDSCHMHPARYPLSPILTSLLVKLLLHLYHSYILTPFRFFHSWFHLLVSSRFLPLVKARNWKRFILSQIMKLFPKFQSDAHELSLLLPDSKHTWGRYVPALTAGLLDFTSNSHRKTWK